MLEVPSWTILLPGAHFVSRIEADGYEACSSPRAFTSKEYYFFKKSRKGEATVGAAVISLLNNSLIYRFKKSLTVCQLTGNGDISQHPCSQLHRATIYLPHIAAI
jgi:hypothetical protein